MQKHIFLRNIYIVIAIASLGFSLFAMYQSIDPGIGVIPLVVATVLGYVHHKIYINNKQNKVVSFLVTCTVITWIGVILTVGLNVICSGVGCYSVFYPLVGTVLFAAITVIVGLISLATKPGAQV